jgi:hypothetical protein
MGLQHAHLGLFLAAQVMLKVSRSAKKLISSFINARICLFYLPQFISYNLFLANRRGVAPLLEFYFIK